MTQPVQPAASPEIPELVKDLAQAFSSHAKATNRFWLTLMGAALFVLPRLPAISPGPFPTIDLPWSLGTVPAVYFFVVSALILSVLSIAFCAAHAQMARVHTLGLEAVRALSSTPTVGQFHMRDVFEVLIMSSFLRVAPLAHLVRGEYRFAHQGKAPRRLIIFSAVYYLVLKLLGALVYLAFPCLALFVVWRACENDSTRLAMPGLQWVPRIFVAFAEFALVQTIASEVRHSWKSFRAILAEKFVS